MKFLSKLFYKTQAVIFLFCCSVTSEAVEYRHEQTVNDLSYGLALYDLFQDKKLAAITDLTVAKEKGYVKNRPDDAELLLASLYFDYGLSDEAENIFSQLLDENTSVSVRNRVWYNLARVQYEYNNYVQAEELLSRISEKLTPLREAEKQYMLTNLHIQQQHFEKAEQAASSIKPEHIWSAYSEYNLGISLAADNNVDNAHKWLEQLISRPTDDNELLSLQDSARLVSGLSLLRQNRLDEAIEYFSAIRVSGVLSNKALLATGWAWSRKSDPQKALTYWNTLVDKAQVDDATMEAYLAIAYAFEQLGNKNMAAQYYASAAERFEQYIQAMDEFIVSIKQRDFIDTLTSDVMHQAGSGDITENRMLSYRATPYIQNIVSSKSFQAALRNHKELLEINNTLSQWKKNLPVLELMLVERRRSFKNKRPQVEKASDFKQLKYLQQQANTLAEEVNRIKQSQDDLALANEDEVDYLEQLEEISDLLSRLEGQRDLSEENEKYRILYGLLYWDISTDFPRRYWQLSQQLQLLDSALIQAETSARSLQQAATVYPQKLADFSQRIAGQDSEIQRQQAKVSQLIDQQEQLINQLVIQAIDGRKQQLVQLRLSARYSLTRVYDELSKQQVIR
jgi:lipopolysaccharide biosynthesis regulator YciM